MNDPVYVHEHREAPIGSEIRLDARDVAGKRNTVKRGPVSDRLPARAGIRIHRYLAFSDDLWDYRHIQVVGSSQLNFFDLGGRSAVSSALAAAGFRFWRRASASTFRLSLRWRTMSA